jgi:hypothetical protein
MRSFFAIGLLSLLFVSVAASQTGAPFSSQSNALGGRFGSPGMGRPLGGINPAASQHRGSGAKDTHRQGAYIAPYGSSFYIPGYFDSFGNYGTPSSVAVYGADNGPEPLPPPAMAPVAPPPPAPVVINQYFSTNTPPQATQQPATDPRTSGEPLGPVENYYLIAYKDHSVYAALSWWVEGKTLHYVTTRNVHNQASMDLIDLDLTRTLNQVRDVPFTLPAQ